MEDLLVSGQVYSLWGALVLIFLFMLFFLRSFWAAALCMIPNLSPILVIFIIMGITGIWLDTATAMIASVAVGIAVDDTIHVFHGFKERVDRGIAPIVALARTYRSAGRAVVTTTLILSAQFLLLMWSDFIPTGNFGLLTTIGLITALLFDLLLLPALLIMIYGRNSPVSGWVAGLIGKRAKIAESGPEAAEPGFDEAYWNRERKCALVKVILSGKLAVADAAREYSLPEAEVEKWLVTAERGIAEAFCDDDFAATPDSAKVKALAKDYARLKAENRELKARQQK
jgi:multidrug efflux pump subunit AcrB